MKDSYESSARLFAIAWTGCMFIILILVFVGVGVINPKTETKPEIPQYEAVWRGTVHQTDTVKTNK